MLLWTEWCYWLCPLLLLACVFIIKFTFCQLRASREKPVVHEQGRKWSEPWLPLFLLTKYFYRTTSTQDRNWKKCWSLLQAMIFSLWWQKRRHDLAGVMRAKLSWCHATKRNKSHLAIWGPTFLTAWTDAILGLQLTSLPPCWWAITKDSSSASMSLLFDSRGMDWLQVKNKAEIGALSDKLEIHVSINKWMWFRLNMIQRRYMKSTQFVLCKVVANFLPSTQYSEALRITWFDTIVAGRPIYKVRFCRTQPPCHTLTTRKML